MFLMIFQKNPHIFFFIMHGFIMIVIDMKLDSICYFLFYLAQTKIFFQGEYLFISFFKLTYTSRKRFDFPLNETLKFAAIIGLNIGHPIFLIYLGRYEVKGLDLQRLFAEPAFVYLYFWGNRRKLMLQFSLTHCFDLLD